jgi:hypothetical protein
LPHFSTIGPFSGVIRFLTMQSPSIRYPFIMV